MRRFRVACALRVAVDFVRDDAVHADATLWCCENIRVMCTRLGPGVAANETRQGLERPGRPLAHDGCALSSTKGRVYPGRGSRASGREGSGRKIAKTTPCKVESAHGNSRAALRPSWWRPAALGHQNDFQFTLILKGACSFRI